MDHEISRFPPLLQVALLALLAGYVLLSVLARVSPRFSGLFDDPAEAHTAWHVVEYTLVPALVLAVAATAVVLRWDPGAPLGGGWSLRRWALGPVAALAGLLLVALASTVGRRGGWLATPEGQRWAWLPLVAMLAGMGLMAVGVVTLGRAVR